MKSLNKNSINLFASTVVSLGFLVGCSGSTDYDFASSKLQQQQQVPLAAEFDPTNGQFPLPNDLLFTGSEDGTLNIPVADPSNFADPRVSMNTLDGFSTTEPAVVNFAQTGTFTVTSVDATSVKLGETARIFEVTRGPGGVVTGVVEELDESAILATVIPSDPTQSPNGTSVAFVPLRPFKESTTYMAMVTNGLANNLGQNLQRGAVFGILASDEEQSDPAAAGLQALIKAMLGAGEAAGVPADDVIMAWSFTTQSISPVIQALKDSAVSTPITIDQSLGGTGALSVASPDQANIFSGTMQVPYYLEVSRDETPNPAVGSFFKNASGSFLTPFDNVPVANEEPVTIPVLMTKPKGTVPDTGWPIAIFQHGITRSRADMLALADAMGSVGIAMIAIDMPMHGIVPEDNLELFRQPEIERHFNLNLNGDDEIDSSGQYFYNPGHLLNTRDNVRQAVADLFTLSASITSLDEIDPSQVFFIGHSLGAIVGTTFLAYDDFVSRATLSSGGSGLPRLLSASPVFGPIINAGIAAEALKAATAAGIDIDSPEGNAFSAAFSNSFLNAAQTVVDSSDPVNHAATLAAKANKTAIHMTEIIGDTVVVNNVPGFPLVGTDALARNLGLENITETKEGSGLVKFEPGYHSSLLRPTVEENNSLVVITEAQALAVFQELQKQVAKFAASGTIVIEDASVLAVPEE